MRIAAIDVGSNSIHMVVAQVESDGRFQVLDRAKEMVRLGQRTLTSGRLSAEAMSAGVRTLAAFKTLAERQGVERFSAVATSAVREAKNGGDFIQRVREEVGLRVKVIPGREEARLIYLGVRHAIDLRTAPTLIVDIGGGSVEFILTENDKPVALDSLKIGVARLSEGFLGEDPPTKKDLAALEAYLAEQLEPVLTVAADRKVRHVVGTSGTMLTLVTMAGYLRGEAPEGHLNNFVVSADEIRGLRRRLAKTDRAERLKLKGLDDKRADLITPGAYLADGVLSRLDAKELVACTWALREGVLLDFIARHRRGIEEVERFGDPRRRSVARLARHLGEIGPHGPRVAGFASQLFDALNDALALPPEAREWLEFAAVLHDVGHHIGHQDHERHSYYLITNGELLGFRRNEIEIIAQTARYHRKGVPRESDDSVAALPKAERRTVRALSALLRLADALDRSHYGVVQAVSVVRRGARVVIQVQTAGDDAEYELWEAQRRAGLLEELLGATVEFEVVAAPDARTVTRAAIGAN